jgi:hypothetical protein
MARAFGVSLEWHVDRACLPAQFSPTSDSGPISVVDRGFDLAAGVVGFADPFPR